MSKQALRDPAVYNISFCFYLDSPEFESRLSTFIPSEDLKELHQDSSFGATPIIETGWNRDDDSTVYRYKCIKKTGDTCILFDGAYVDCEDDFEHLLALNTQAADSSFHSIVVFTAEADSGCQVDLNRFGLETSRQYEDVHGTVAFNNALDRFAVLCHKDRDSMAWRDRFVLSILPTLATYFGKAGVIAKNRHQWSKEAKVIKSEINAEMETFSDGIATAKLNTTEAYSAKIASLMAKFAVPLSKAHLDLQTLRIAEDNIASVLECYVDQSPEASVFADYFLSPIRHLRQQFEADLGYLDITSKYSLAVLESIETEVQVSNRRNQKLLTVLVLMLNFLAIEQLIPGNAAWQSLLAAGFGLFIGIWYWNDKYPFGRN